MREIQVGEKTMRVRATPLALLFYKQEFKSDLLAELMNMQKLQTDPAAFDSVAMLQITWALNKANEPLQNSFPGFESWLSELDSFDFSDNALMTAILDEAQDGFFRGAAAAGAKG